MRAFFPWLLLASAIACSASTTGGPPPDDAGSSQGPADAEPDVHVEAGADPAPDASPGLDASAGPDAESGPEPMVVVQPSFTTLYAMSDIHAHLNELTTLLIASGLVDASSTFPDGIQWTGADATLVIAGDLIDKGPSSLGTLETVRALQSAAPAGHVVVLLGNHEVEFFADPTNDKFMGADRIDRELGEQIPPIDPTAFAHGDFPLSAWLRQRPIAAKIGSWFFAHGGNTGGRSTSELDAALQTARAGTLGFADPVFLGDDSVLEAQEWYTSPALVTDAVAALGVRRLAFGHDPGAFDEHGRLLVPAAFGGNLVKLDTGLGNDDSDGELLRVRIDGENEVVEAIAPSGTVRELDRRPSGT